MKESGENFELGEKFPSTLDIVRIDGRWGQVVANKLNSKDVTIRFLDDGTMDRVDLDEYYLAQGFGVELNVLKEDFGISLSLAEAERVHWGADAKERPELKKQVTVFGEYKKPN